MKNLYVISGKKSIWPQGVVSIQMEPDAGKMMAELRGKLHTNPAFLLHQIINAGVDLEIADNPFFPTQPEISRPIIYDFMKLLAGENYREKNLRILEIQEIREGWD